MNYEIAVQLGWSGSTEISEMEMKLIETNQHQKHQYCRQPSRKVTR